MKKPEKWTGKLLGKMHLANVSCKDLAEEMGVSRGYISMVIHGSRNPANIQQRMEDALNAVIARRKEQNDEEKN